MPTIAQVVSVTRTYPPEPQAVVLLLFSHGPSGRKSRASSLKACEILQMRAMKKFRMINNVIYQISIFRVNVN